MQTARLRKKGVVTDDMTVEEILQCTLQARADAKEREKLMRRQRLEASRLVCTAEPCKAASLQKSELFTVHALKKDTRCEVDGGLCSAKS